MIDALTKTYGGFTAVDHVTFSAEAGRVTGFLGPNGAGKSTTMRILVGLTPASSGTATVLGRRYADLPNPGREIGVLLDASAQHAGRTGREILTLAQRTTRMPKERVDEMLDLVSLTPEESGRRVRDYSLGMRQRLGIATALIGDPEVLVLDEPANGLDPAGIRWMRDLLRGYADQGGTVLLSSHLLHEIEVVADDLVVIGNGRIVAAGTKGELLASAGTYAGAADAAALAAALTSAGHSAQHSLGGHPDRRRHRRGRARRARRRRTPDRAAARRRGRTRGDVPRAHRGQRTRGRGGMSHTAVIEETTTTDAGARARAGGARAHPVPHRRRRGAPQDVRHPVGLLADGRHRGRGRARDRARSSPSPPSSDLTYDSFAGAIGVPMTILLPVVAILVGHRGVEPAGRADDVHPGAPPRPGDPGQDGRHRAGRRRLDGARASASARSATSSAPR